MAREYPPWDMTDPTRARLSAGMDEAMYSGVPAGDDIEGIIGAVGRDAVIASFAGTTDKSTREWRNARDRVSRYRRGARSIRGSAREHLSGVAQGARRREIGQARIVHVRVEATFRTSSKTWGYADAYLTGPDRDDFLTARDAGDDELAMKIAMEAYGLDPEFVLGVDDFGGFDIDWESPS
jgi:hypothetical protein